MDQAVIENIRKMPAMGNRLELPKDEQFTNYPAVKKTLLQAGAKYVKCGFVFPSNAEEIKIRLTGGEVINDKKKFQFFPTPDALAEELVNQACIASHHRTLEPSAGHGAIANHLHARCGLCTLVELNPDCCQYLIEHGYNCVVQKDFLQLHKEDLGTFDRIVANPPFTKNQDVDHILHMYKFLAPGGQLVSIASTSWRNGQQKKQKEFCLWLEEHNAKVTEVSAGAFKESGTGVSSVIIQITKPAGE